MSQLFSPCVSNSIPVSFTCHGDLGEVALRKNIYRLRTRGIATILKRARYLVGGPLASPIAEDALTLGDSIPDAAKDVEAAKKKATAEKRRKPS